MITIFERQRRMASGVTSLFASFPYDKRLVDVAKSADVHIYHKDTHEWEFPITELAGLIDKFVLYDDVRLVPLADSEEKEDEPLLSTFKTEPRDYQLDAIRYGLSHPKFLLLDEPGLGKTLEIICMAEELRLREGLEHCLVICGLASLRMNWLKEIEKHSNLNGTVLGARINRNGNLVWDSIQKRVDRLMSPIDEFFVIVNIETIRDERIVDAICNGPNKFGFIVIDEGHCCKSWKSIQGNNVLSLEAPHKVIATGTPLLNSPLDTYMMLTWIGRESKKGITKFKETYCVQVPVIKNGKPHPFHKRVVGYKNLDLLKQVLDSCSIRRTKDILNLPEKTIIDEVLVMDPAQEQFYRKLRDSIKKSSRQEGIDACDKIKLKPQLVRSYIARLRQATSCPQLLTSQEISSIKVDRAIELAREIVQNGSKVVILSQFKEPVSQLMEALKDLNPLLGTGDVPEGEFSANVDLFQEDNEHMAFIGTCSKCGTGLTLNRASYMIFIDQPWTWGEYQQCTDRIHRIGTKRPVFVYNLICRDTIDEVVSSVINRKRSLSDFVVDDVDNGETLEAIRRYVLDE